MLISFYFIISQGNGVTGLIRGLATIPQTNQEPLVVKMRLEDLQMNLG